MEISATAKKQIFPFPVAALFFIGYSVLNLSRVLILFIGRLINFIREHDFYFLKDFISFGNFFNIVFCSLLLIFAILLIIRKLNVATPIVMCGITAVYLLFFISNIISFIVFLLSATGAKNIFVLLFGLPDYISYIFEWLGTTLLSQTVQYAGIILYLCAFILLIPITFMSLRKNKSKIWNIICFIPCILAVIAVGLNVISYIINMMLSFGSGAYYIFNSFIDTFLMMGIIFCSLWFSKVFKIQREYASVEDEKHKSGEVDPAPMEAPANNPEKVPAKAVQNKASSISNDKKSLFIKEPSSVAAQAPQAKKKPAEIGTADELIKYKTLLDSGVITEDEFKEIKNRLLNI